jgi:hypothetical protein
MKLLFVKLRMFMVHKNFMAVFFKKKEIKT